MDWINLSFSVYNLHSDGISVAVVPLETDTCRVHLIRTDIHRFYERIRVLDVNCCVCVYTYLVTLLSCASLDEQFVFVKKM